jgi:2-iminoacetate synthase ThiH
MNESITRSAGGVHGQEFDAAQLAALAAGIGRPARQRTTLYGAASAGVVGVPGAGRLAAAGGNAAAQ